jgi:hypothetical protein
MQPTSSPGVSPKPKAPRFGWHRLTLPQLAFAVAAPVLATRGLTPLSRIGADAVVARLVHRMNAEGGLSQYKSVVGTPGFPRAVASVTAELRLARIPPDRVADSAPHLAPLVAAFEVELREAGLTDWAGVLTLLPTRPAWSVTAVLALSACRCFCWTRR